MRTAILASLIALILLSPAPAAFAHRPDWGNDGLMPIDDISTSYAFYRELTAGQVDAYSLTAQAGDVLHGGISVPALPGEESYQVALAVFGPGLPPLDPSQRPLLPAVAPEFMGGVLLPPTRSADFFEPFTQTNYWGRQQFDLKLPAGGTYYVLVWNVAGQPGKYVLATGQVERFGPADAVLFPIWWLRVHWFFGHGPVLLLAAGALSALALMLARRRWSYSSASQAPAASS